MNVVELEILGQVATTLRGMAMDRHTPALARRTLSDQAAKIETLVERHVN